MGAVEALNKLYDKNNKIIFFTAQYEKDREVTDKLLKKHGSKYHGLLMNKPRGENYKYF